MRPFEVPEDNGSIAERVRRFGIADWNQRPLADRVPAGRHRGDGVHTWSRASQTMEDAAMQAGTRPNKRTGLSGRTALKLKRLDGARRADHAASDARVTKASSSIAVALLLISSGASATECQSSAGHDGKWWSYRIVDGGTAGIRAALVAPRTCCAGPGNRRRQPWSARSPATARTLHCQSRRSSLPRSSTQHRSRPRPCRSRR
jgi:hypothetical protein